MQRYFVKNKEHEKIVFYEKDIHHIKNVMRYRKGDEIEIVYDKKLYLCTIDNIDPLEVIIQKEIPYNEDFFNLTIAVSLVSEQKFDLILQKLTELGVTKIIPLKTERSIVKIDEKKALKKYQRWQTICKEASEQSKRISIPQITEIYNINQLKDIPSKNKIICTLNATSKPINEYLNNDLNDLLVVIGPEGGFSKSEEDILNKNNFKSASLGNNVLRVETATFYVASIIKYIYGGRYNE